jgi:hypothetical protein
MAFHVCTGSKPVDEQVYKEQGVRRELRTIAGGENLELLIRRQRVMSASIQ